MITKSELRSRLRQKLEKITFPQRLEWSALATEKLMALDEIQTAKRILLFASLPDEIDTQIVFQHLREKDKSIAYPKVNSLTHRLTCHLVTSQEELASGQFGILEPSSPEIPLEQIDVILVPGLAFDRQGNRLGRGQGFFDRFLASAKPETKRIGFFYALQEVEAVPKDSWDYSLHTVVTNLEVIRCS